LKTNLISKSETNQIIKLVSNQWKRELPKIKNLKVHFIDNNSQLMVGDGMIILKIGDNYLPFLSQNDMLEKFPNVIVDMGAVKFMCNGANVMRPGIKKYTEFVKGDIIYVEILQPHK
jgi:PUA domain protein